MHFAITFCAAMEDTANWARMATLTLHTSFKDQPIAVPSAESNKYWQLHSLRST